LPFQLAALIWFQPPTCCLLADAIPGNTLAASLLIQLIVGEIVVTPRTRLRAWNNPGNVRVLVTSLAGLVRLSDFGFFTTPGFLLLAFLLGAFARPFLLSDLVRFAMENLPVSVAAMRVRKKGRSATGPGRMRETAGSRFGHPV